MTGNNAFAHFVPWAPPWAVAAALLAAGVAMAMIVHAVFYFLLRRLSEHRHPMLHALMLRTRAITLYAFIMVALSVVLPMTPLGDGVADSIHKILLAAFIIFLGWAAIVGANMTLDRYTSHFRLDTADNLLARKAITQIRVFKRAIDILLALLALGCALMSFDSVRQFGVSLFASAGVAGIAAGLAARPVLGNLIAGMQIAITQPIRLDDVLVINNQWGTVEEITSTYVVLKLWDWRRYVVPLSYFFDTPFENWTRSSANIIGTVFLYLDYTAPVGRIRTKLEEIVKQSKLWDGKVVNLQISDAREQTIEVRALVSAANSSAVWDLRCEVREKLIDFVESEFPAALPHARSEVSMASAGTPSVTPLRTVDRKST